MKITYKRDYEQFPGGTIKPKEKLEFECTVEESVDLGDNFMKILRTIEEIKHRGRSE
jgi:hypothetical protein